MQAELHPVTAIHTEIYPHPTRNGWAVFALVATELGNVLYVSQDAWVLRESAAQWQRDTLDGTLDALIAKVNEAIDSGTDTPDLFAEIEALDTLKRMPTPWRPGQFDAID